MKKPTTIETLQKAVVAGLSPLGIKPADIVHSARGLSIPSAGVVLALKLSEDGGRRPAKAGDDARVWSAVEHFTTADLEGHEHKSERVLFELPLGREWQVARVLAMSIAQRRIDAAIDAATA